MVAQADAFTKVIEEKVTTMTALSTHQNLSQDADLLLEESLTLDLLNKTPLYREESLGSTTEIRTKSLDLLLRRVSSVVNLGSIELEKAKSLQLEGLPLAAHLAVEP